MGGGGSRRDARPVPGGLGVVLTVGTSMANPSRRRAVAAAVLLVTAGTTLRLAYFSGYGLGDDPNFKATIESIVSNGPVIWLPKQAYTYRVTWWLPTGVACRLFGVSERALILPITAMAVLGMIVVFAFAPLLWGLAGAVIARLLTTYPPDSAWSTMLTNDICCSLGGALCVLAAVAALRAPPGSRRQWLWVACAANLLIVYHAKASAIVLVCPIAVAGWLARDRVTRDDWVFPIAVSILFGLAFLFAYALTGDALVPFFWEIRDGGLLNADAAEYHRLADSFWSFPRWLFWRDRYGHFLNGLDAIVFVVLATLSPWLGVRTDLVILAWLLVTFVSLQFQMLPRGGVWVTIFRNMRHMHVLVYPLVLLLTGYLVELRRRRPRLAHATLAGLLGFGLWQSVATANVTHVAFGDMRAAATYLARLPRKPVYADIHLVSWWQILGVPGWTFQALSWDPVVRRRELANVADGYAVTGGGREPYFGCNTCIARAMELDPDRWILLKEFPGPREPVAWRLEPLRIWQARATGSALAK